jgi:hypothetical protein
MGRIGSTNTFAQRSATSGGESGTMEVSDGLLPLGEWANYTITRSGTNGLTYASYKNGAVILGPAEGDASFAINPVSRTLNYIGRALWADENLRGRVDEVRVQKVARSADWVMTEFENQKAAQTVVALTDALVPITTTGIGGLASRLEGPSLSFQPMGQGLLFQIRGEAAAKARLSVVDMQGRLIWARNVNTVAGMNHVVWDGMSRQGQGVGTGIYVVRMALIDANGKAIQRLDRKIPLTR